MYKEIKHSCENNRLNDQYNEFTHLKKVIYVFVLSKGVNVYLYLLEH